MYIKRCCGVSSDAGVGAVFFPCPHRGQCQADFPQTQLPSFGTYVVHVGSDVHVVSVPDSRGQTHVTPEPSMSRLSGTLAIIHFPRKGEMEAQRKNNLFKVTKTSPLLTPVLEFVFLSSFYFSCCTCILWKQGHSH